LVTEHVPGHAIHLLNRSVILLEEERVEIAQSVKGRAKGRRSIPASDRIFSSPQRPAVGPIQSSAQRIKTALLPGLERPGREPGHLPGPLLVGIYFHSSILSHGVMLNSLCTDAYIDYK
jgi:hypothetical protein